MGKYTIFYLLENPRRGMQARNFTTNVPKILDLKSSSEQIFSRKLSLGVPVPSAIVIAKWNEITIQYDIGADSGDSANRINFVASQSSACSLGNFSQVNQLRNTGCPKSSFLYFISLYFSTIGLRKQIISTKVVSFNIIHYFHTFCAIFWLEYSIRVLPHQRCACASIFSSHIFFVFHTPNC